MYVDVIFRNGTKGRILKAEYEANKDNGYINCLSSEYVEKQAEMPLENKMVIPKHENKGRKRRG